jgi:hypothetical protein
MLVRAPRSYERSSFFVPGGPTLRPKSTELVTARPKWNPVNLRPKDPQTPALFRLAIHGQGAAPTTSITALPDRNRAHGKSFCCNGHRIQSTC